MSETYEKCGRAIGRAIAAVIVAFLFSLWGWTVIWILVAIEAVTAAYFFACARSE